MKLIDTTVAIDHLRGNESAVQLLRGLIADDERVAASELVRFELLAGVRSDELDELEGFFSAVAWVPVDEGIARSAGLLASRHRQAYGGIDDVDYLIAATALLLGAELLTTNVRHFPMLPDLEPPY
ncbi:MAG: type II toxin-antitoxin system VapC family toxin [Acidimicrobiia bacterium]|nr:type II toxin-antitoxin system VapC family toxin [Acidimicrobiia bacterium]